MPLLMILLFCIAVYLLAGLLIFQFIFHRQPDPDWTSTAALEKTMWKDYAKTIPKTVQWLQDHNAQDVYIQSFDGLTLTGKWVPCDRPRATILVVHGYHSSYVTDFGEIFPLYQQFNILMLRQRAHGASQGTYITFGAHEHRDLLDWINFHNTTYGALPMFISGMSMGASTVLYAAGEALPENVKGITADCGFTSPWEIIGKVMHDRTHCNVNFLLPSINLWCRLLANFDMRAYHTAKTLSTATVPVLMVHGEADDLVPCEMSRTGFAACASEKQLFTVKDAGHGTSYLFDRERLGNALVNFFESHL